MHIMALWKGGMHSNATVETRMARIEARSRADIAGVNEHSVDDLACQKRGVRASLSDIGGLRRSEEVVGDGGARLERLNMDRELLHIRRPRNFDRSTNEITTLRKSKQ